MMPILALPAGLGKINVLSALGQPLMAEIDLVSVSAEEFPSLAAKLASQDAYREANVEYPNGVGGFRFVIGKRANGQPYLQVVTSQPINEPFVDLLIELNWASGRLLREYPVLLDPPGYNVEKPQAATITPPQAARPSPQAKPAPSAARPPPQTEPRITQGTEKTPSIAASEKAASEVSDTYGPVRFGETLRKIAVSTRPANVSLEQMLVALYRENKGAFVGRNMNRLKTGMILKVPASSEAASLSPQSAKQVVIAQTADWNAYRKRLAGAASAGKRSGQSASGSIDTRIGDEAAPPDSGKDVLKLSKGEVTPGKAGIAGSQVGQEKLNSLQEEVATREKALEDARSRISLLENEIAKMRQLLELKGTPLPADQPPVIDKNREPSTAVATPPVEPIAPKAVEIESKPAAVPELPAAIPDKASKPIGEDAPPKPMKPKRVSPPPDQPGFVEEWLENPLAPVAGAVILALLGFLGYLQFQKRKDAQLGAFTAPPGGFKVAPAVAPAPLIPDDGNSSFLTDFDKVGAGNIDTDEVDPVAEADVYIAYGRDAQAEEILKEANAKDPTRYEIPLKLLEIYSNRKSAQSFEAVAKQLNNTIGAQHPLWSKVAEMGRKLDSHNPLYASVALTSDTERSGESTVSRAFASVAAAAQRPVEQMPKAMTDTLTVKEPVIEHAPLDLDLDFNTAPVPGQTIDVSAAKPLPDARMLDFDLGEAGGATSGDVASGAGKPSTSVDPFVLDFDLEEPSATPANRQTAPSLAPAASGEFVMDFDLGDAPALDKTPDPPESPESAHPDLELGSGVDLPPLDLSHIDLNLGALDSADADAEAQTGGNWQSAETKLDLARAYLEIGDKVGAVEILQEVIIEGSAEQQEEAKKLSAQA
ncbi:MAG: FimV/HubP family polar landmark protein [Burkholderiales bacterium]